MHAQVYSCNGVADDEHRISLLKNVVVPLLVQRKDVDDVFLLIHRTVFTRILMNGKLGITPRLMCATVCFAKYLQVW